MHSLRLIAPWRDRAGAVSPLKALVFALLFVPAGLAAWTLFLGPPVTRPVTVALHLLGRWAIYFLLASLAITPLRFALDWPRLILVRRMLGVAAFACAAAHLGLYVVDLKFALGKVVSEIALRVYLTLGFAGLLILAALAATSTDAMIARLGSGRWQRLHRLAYAAIAIGVVHYFLQTKLDLWKPTLVAGVAAWLLAFRLVQWRGGGALAGRTSTLLALALLVPLAVALADTAYLALKFGAPPALVAEAQLDLFDMGPRPAAWLLAGGFALALLAWLRRALAGGRPRSGVGRLATAQARR